MSISLSQWTFEGPYTSTANLRDQGGVYAILDRRWDEKWHVLDVGESSQVKTRVENHDRSDCWASSRQGTLGYAVLYTPGWTADQRRAAESKIRAAFSPVCGVL